MGAGVSYHPYDGSAPRLVCEGCVLQDVVVEIYAPDGTRMLRQASEVVAPRYHYFAVAALGYNDSDVGNGTVRIANVTATLSDGSMVAPDGVVSIEHGATGGGYAPLSWNESAGAFTGRSSTQLSCSPSYAGVRLTPSDGTWITRLDAIITLAQPPIGDGSYWELQVGTLSDMARPVSTSRFCQSGVPQGSVDGFVGAQVSGDGRGARHYARAVLDELPAQGERAEINPFTKYRIVVTATPRSLIAGADLQAAPARFSHNPRWGDYLVATRVHNAGDTATAATVTRFAFDGEPWLDVDVPALAPGQAMELLVDADPNHVPQEATLTVTADALDAVAEEDETNNLADTALVFDTWGRADLVIGEWFLAPATPTVGTAQSVYVTVANSQGGESGAFDVRVVIDGLLAQTHRAPSLGYEDAHTVRVDFAIPTEGVHRLRVEADSAYEVSEEHEDDNVADLAFYVASASARPDVALSDLIAVPIPDEAATFLLAQACNLGDAVARDVSVVARAEAVGPLGVMTTRMVGTRSYAAILPGECVDPYFVDSGLVTMGRYEYVLRAVIAGGDLNPSNDEVRIEQGDSSAQFGVVV